jgi:hypothetical protein
MANRAVETGGEDGERPDVTLLVSGRDRERPIILAPQARATLPSRASVLTQTKGTIECRSDMTSLQRFSDTSYIWMVDSERHKSLSSPFCGFGLGRYLAQLTVNDSYPAAHVSLVLLRRVQTATFDDAAAARDPSAAVRVAPPPPRQQEDRASRRAAKSQAHTPRELKRWRRKRCCCVRART